MYLASSAAFNALCDFSPCGKRAPEDEAMLNIIGDAHCEIFLVFEHRQHLMTSEHLRYQRHKLWDRIIKEKMEQERGS